VSIVNWLFYIVETVKSLCLEYSFRFLAFQTFVLKPCDFECNSKKEHGHVVELKNNFMDGVMSKLKKDHVK
jgi:hypothetical protein